MRRRCCIGVTSAAGRAATGRRLGNGLKAVPVRRAQSSCLLVAGASLLRLGALLGGGQLRLALLGLRELQAHLRLARLGGIVLLQHALRAAHTCRQGGGRG